MTLSIVKLIVGLVMIFVSNIMPTLLSNDELLVSNKINTDIVSVLDTLSTSLASGVSVLSNVLFIMGLFMLIVGLFGFYNHVQKESGNVDFNDKKEKISELQSLAIILGNDKKRFDFENLQLNDLVSNINKLSKELKDNVFVNKNKEWAFIVEKSNNEYLEKIYQNHKHIPKNRLSEKHINNTKEQLKLILIGLNKIEENVEKEVISNQKINEYFLEEKVKSIGEY